MPEELASALAPVALAVGMFVSTNIDDLLLLAAFFAHPGMRAAAVVGGQFLGIGVLTVASGGDNLAVYVPVFARDAVWLPAYALVFALMTALRCLLARRLAEHPQLGSGIRRHAEKILPPVLIALGLYVLADARVLLP